MPSAAAQDVLQAILEQRAAEKRRALGAAAAPMALPFANSRIGGAFEAAQPVRQVDELSAPITLPFAARNQLGDWGPRMPNVLKTIADPRTSPIGPAAIARLFYDPAGEAGRQAETGKRLVEPFTQFNDPNVDPVKQAADLTMTVMGGSSVVPAAANELRMGIKAYHGSPHDFERFDASKIGTGEGAQAYGHGLYLAENEAVAKDYKTKLSEPVVKASAAPDVDPEVARTLNDYASGTIDNDPSRARQDILDQLAKEIPDTEAFIRKLGPERYGQHQEVVDSLPLLYRMRDAILADKVSFKLDKGHMYEVDIAADPEQFLDWDKPLSEQKLKAEAIDPVLSRAVPSPKNPQPYTLDELSSMGATGRDLYDRLSWASGKPGAFPEINVATPAGASSALREAGIPGIRYLDQGSRGNPNWTVDGVPASRFEAKNAVERRAIDVLRRNSTVDEAISYLQQDSGTEAAQAWLRENAARIKSEGGTSNYVVFPGNEHLIAILKKYGLPISAAGLAALSQLHPQEAQAAQQKPQNQLPRY